MVDALSLFGAVGTTAGVISFLVSTVEILNKKFHDFNEGTDHLNHYRQRMIMIKEVLQNWRRIWHNKYQNPFPDTTYTLFWGSTGFEEVKRMILCIERENESIINFLYCKAEDSPKISNQDEWGQILIQLSSGRTSRPCEDGWLKKLVYALFQGSLLKERIDRLKEEVELLVQYSRSRYWMLLDQDSDPNNWIKPEKLRRANELHTQLTGASEEMKRIYDTEINSKNWRLVLGKPPPDETLRNLADGLEFWVEFVTQRSKKYELITVKVDPAQSMDCVEKANVRTISFEGIGIEMSIKRLLREALTDVNLRKQKETTFGIVAIKLVKSTVLLYEAPWTRRLCTCGILIADTMDGEEDICTFREKSDDACHDSATSEQRFLHLAIALAELCLATTIRLTTTVNRQQLYSFDILVLNPTAIASTKRRDIAQIGKYWKTVSEVELLRMVHRKTGSRAYKLSLESCLSLARSEVSDDTTIRPERISRSPEEIVKP